MSENSNGQEMSYVFFFISKGTSKGIKLTKFFFYQEEGILL